MEVMAILSNEKQREIDIKIKNIRERTSLSYPQNSLLEISNSLGVKVFFLDLPHGSKEVDGIIKWDDKGGATVVINNNFSPKRKTFTLAHELGHFVLHPNKDRLRIDLFDYSQDSLISEEETQANYFAASLLMPKEDFIRVFRITDGSISGIAEYFGVSELAVKNRLRWIQRN